MMPDEVERHPEIAALLDGAARVRGLALIAATVGLLAWGVYEATADAANRRARAAPT